MFMKLETYPAALLELVSEANSAAKAIPPLFPLSASVAVNPFLGQTGEPLAVTAARLARVAGGRITPERQHWAAKLAAGEILDEDLRAALSGMDGPFYRPSLEDVKAALGSEGDAPQALPTVAELAADVSGIDWPGLIEERIGHWAASHFDQGQALWQPGRAGGAYTAWREYAMRDLTPEIHGLTGFAAFVADTNRSHWRVIGRASEALGVSSAAAGTLFHRWLCTLGGWAQYARYLLWQAELEGGSDNTVTELLAIRMVFEEAVFALYREQIAERWQEVVEAHEAPVAPGRAEVIDAVLQEAAERAGQRKLAGMLAEAAPRKREGRPQVQAAFCIDVRSEVFRRALEAQDAGIETIGFAGFFGLASAHKAAGSDVTEARGPVLLNAGVQSEAAEPEQASHDRRYAARAKRAWGRFKLAAVSSFAFVEATGPVYAGKLLRDALAPGGKPAAAEPAPQLDPAIGLEARITMAKTVLGAMSLTKDFAKMVMLVGHGADVTNNPHESALHCGACGGYAGDVNARLLAGLLNDAKVREGLREHGIEIPSDTVFLPAMHHTTTDRVTLYEQDLPNGPWKDAVARLQSWLEAAGRLARAERAGRLPRAGGEADVLRRAQDWAELRPEWGLAGCRAFIAAPRHRTEGTALAGQSFLHSYDWQSDEGFGVLELILTAPVVVASWISLQYYGSTVAPELFGGGNKLLHNVAGGIGVLEGNGGALRSGLPWQSVHDGSGLQHDPVRLTVAIEAPREAMSEIFGRHPQVKALFDNRWLHLFAMDDAGQLAWRYEGDLAWSPAGNREAETALAAE
ncbi:YbcC family protein [Cribrihabitans neustonicus]|uniref:YbcC family protein n=1 Tax=Cribrihabitans neustonicus TaxID=1429085 RepID=UPI003B5BE6E3